MFEVNGRGEFLVQRASIAHQIACNRFDVFHLNVEQQLSLLVIDQCVLYTAGGARSLARCRNLEFDLLVLDLVVDLREELFGQVAALVDAAVHLDVLFFGHLFLHLFCPLTKDENPKLSQTTHVDTVQICGQHDHRIGKHVGCVSAGEYLRTEYHVGEERSREGGHG